MTEKGQPRWSRINNCGVPWDPMSVFRLYYRAFKLIHVARASTDPSRVYLPNYCVNSRRRRARAISHRARHSRHKLEMQKEVYPGKISREVRGTCRARRVSENCSASLNRGPITSSAVAAACHANCDLDRHRSGTIQFGGLQRSRKNYKFQGWSARRRST